MATEFAQIDVFATAPYTGNPLAVFPDAAHLSTGQMQAIASEMNLSETAFVTNTTDDSYDIRIFTPTNELPFAGHPSIGTAWYLRALGRTTQEHVEQRSPAGVTPITHRDDEVSLTRTGSVGDEIEEVAAIAGALGLPDDAIGAEAGFFGRGHGVLVPAVADAGLRQLMVPIRDRGWLAACTPKPEEILRITPIGMYCFTHSDHGEAQARAFLPGIGIAEDPATGAAAAGLGLYLSARLGQIQLDVLQGVEMGRPSRIGLRADHDTVEISGRSVLVLKGSLEELP